MPLNYYAEARSLLVNLKTALGYQKVVKVCSAIIKVLKRYNLLNHPQYRPYQIAKECVCQASVSINISMSTIKKENGQKIVMIEYYFHSPRASIRWNIESEASVAADIRQNMRKVVQGQCGEISYQKQLAKLSQDQFAVINNYPIYERTKQAQINHIGACQRSEYM